jgi:hypothetical protein
MVLQPSTPGLARLLGFVKRSYVELTLRIIDGSCLTASLTCHRRWATAIGSYARTLYDRNDRISARPEQRGRTELTAGLHQQEASGPDAPTWLLAGKSGSQTSRPAADQRPVESSANPQASRTSRTKRKDKP